MVLHSKDRLAEKEVKNPCQHSGLEIYADEAAYRRHIEILHFRKYKEGTLEMVKELELLNTTPLIPGLSSYLIRNQMSLFSASVPLLFRNKSHCIIQHRILIPQEIRNCLRDRVMRRYADPFHRESLG